MGVVGRVAAAATAGVAADVTDVAVVAVGIATVADVDRGTSYTPCVGTATAVESTPPLPATWLMSVQTRPESGSNLFMVGPLHQGTSPTRLIGRQAWPERRRKRKKILHIGGEVCEQNNHIFI